MSSSSFEGVQYALERLHMEDLDPRDKQLQSMAVYDGLNVFVCLSTDPGFGKKSLLPGHSFRDGLQAGKS